MLTGVYGFAAHKLEQNSVIAEGGGVFTGQTKAEARADLNDAFLRDATSFVHVRRTGSSFLLPARPQHASVAHLPARAPRAENGPAPHLPPQTQTHPHPHPPPPPPPHAHAHARTHTHTHTHARARACVA